MSIDIPVVSKFDPKGLKQAQSALGGFKKTLGTVAVALGAALSVRAVTSFAKASINEASNLEESLNALSVSYGDASEGIAKLGEDAATRLGVTQAAFNQAAVRFSAFADRVVGEGGDVTGFVDDITTRATDFASVFNIDVAEALQVFQSGLAGEAEPLKRFGINLLQSEVQAFALREGLIQVGETMTEQQKVQARYGLIMETTAKTAGDFANTSDGLANSQRILEASFKTMQAEIGGPVLNAFANLSAGLVPVVQQLGPILTEALDKLSPKLDGLVESVLEVLPSLISFSGTLSGVFELLDERFSALRTAAQPAIDAFVDMRDRLPELGSALDKILTVVQNVSAMAFAGLLTIGLQVATQLLPALLDAFVKVLPPILELIEASSGVLIPVLLTLAQAVIPIFVAILNVLTPIVQGLARIVAATGGSLTTLALIVFGAVKAFAAFKAVALLTSGVMTGLKIAMAGSTGATFLHTNAQKLGLVVGKLLTGQYILQAGALVTNTTHLIASKVALVAQTVATNGARVAQLALNLALKANPMGLIIAALAAVTTALIWFFTNTEMGRAIISGAFEFFKAAIDGFAEGFMFVFTEALPEAFTFFKDLLSGLINGMITRFEGFVNGVIGGVNGIIRAFNRLSISVPATAFTDAFTIGFNIPTIPNIALPRVALAEGGIVTGPMNALIGEAGPEAVIPLDRLGKMGGNTYNITVNSGPGTNGAQVGEQIVNLIRKYERTSGPVFARA
jgi:hypothetical protein